VIYLIFILLSIALLVGFFLLTKSEAQKGVRYLAPRRSALDAQVGRIEFILTHVDFASFAREEGRRLFGLVSHALAHLSLQLVRSVERLLTRTVRHLRTQHQAAPSVSGGETREFVKTLSDFKGRLKDTMPEMAPVEKQD
jgi:hypothetical protein